MTFNFDDDESRHGVANEPVSANSTHAKNNTSNEDRVARRLRLFNRLYGLEYRADPLRHSWGRRRAIEAGDGFPSLLELLTGAEFHGENFDRDLAAFSRIFLRYEKVLRRYFPKGRDREALPQLDAVFDAFKIARLDVPRAAIRQIRDALDDLKFAGPSEHYAVAFGRPEFADRLQFYLACANDRPAQARIAALCLHAAIFSQVKDDEIRALKCALAWLSRSQTMTKFPHPFLSGPQILVEGGAIMRGIGRTVPFVVLAAAFGAEGEKLETPPDETQKDNGEKREDPRAFAMKIREKRQERKAAEKEPDGPGMVVFAGKKSGADKLEPEAYSEIFGKTIRLAQPPDLKQAAVLLLAEFPYAGAVIMTLLRDVGTARDAIGRPIIRIRPTILVGEPGNGKSLFAMKFSEAMGLPHLLFAAAGVADSMFGASNKKWSNTGPALPVERIFVERIANLLVILDEIEKTGTRRENGRLEDVILNMVETSTARTYFDQSLSSMVDLSALNWLCTANSVDQLSAPLRDRFRILRFPSPSREHLPVLLPALLREIGRERYGDERWVSPLDGTELQQIKNVWPGGSIRVLKRLVEAVLDSRDLFQPKM